MQEERNSFFIPDFEIQVNKFGKIFMPAKETFLYVLSNFPNTTFYLTVSRTSKRKITNLQRQYYFPVIVQRFMIEANNQGNEIKDKEQAHEMLKGLFPKYFVREKKWILPNGDLSVRKYEVGLSDLKTIDAESYFEDCRQWIKEWFAYECPLPDKNWRKKFD